MTLSPKTRFARMVKLRAPKRFRPPARTLAVLWDPHKDIYIHHTKNPKFFPPRSSPRRHPEEWKPRPAGRARVPVIRAPHPGPPIRHPQSPRNPLTPPHAVPSRRLPHQIRELQALLASSRRLPPRILAPPHSRRKNAVIPRSPLPWISRIISYQVLC